MADNYASIDNVKFLLYDVHNLESLFEKPYFSDFNQETIDMMIDATKKTADRELFPYLSEMDTQGCVLENGEVKVHSQVAKVQLELGQSGYINASHSYEDGGMQLPHMAHYASGFIYTAANNSLIGYTMLTAGAARLITSFGKEELKRTYSDKMYAGKWQGTMCLTEPDAGSSLSDIVTAAKRKDDDTFKITGQKIFISGGDYNDVENVVHLVLAKIEGAPKGAKGISLFVVPKKRVEGNGLVPNDVTTAGLFHKMGQHGYVTTHLMFGEKDGCEGYLVGEENMGLKYMFQMMNSARVEVGLMGASIASAAYYASLEYANERSQGRKPQSKSPNDTPISILEHADVRRMLYFQKSIVEGSLSLVMECAKYIDLIDASKGNVNQDDYLLLELLTPIVKTYPTEKGIESVSAGMQCLGGYGFCVDFPLEQLYRDIRITTLYEGTTGIQSMDLLGRKMTMQNGKAAKLLFIEITKTLQEAEKIESTRRHAAKLATVLGEYQKVLGRLMGLAAGGKVEAFLSDANLFMELSGNVVLGWQWIKQGIAAQKALDSGADNSLFYESKIKTMEFYFAYEIPKTAGLIQRLMDDELITIKGDKEYLM